jgi:hypothetical protein
VIDTSVPPPHFTEIELYLNAQLCEVRKQLDEMEKAILSIVDFMKEARALVDSMPSVKMRRAFSAKRPVIGE